MNSQKPLPVEIADFGTCLPENVLTNRDLERMVDTSDEWIVQRTGISERRVLGDGQSTSDLALGAARQVLERTGVQPAELDIILVATCTPDYLFPATACLVQAELGADDAMACDLQAACSGFLYGFTYAAGLISGGLAANALLIGAEGLTRFTDYTDRRSCILFGDGAGAALLRPSRDGGRVLHAELGAEGSRPEILYVPAGGARKPATHGTVDEHEHYMHLRGREVFKAAVNKLIELVQRIPDKTGVCLDDIKVVIPHQSNVRIINAAMERTGMDPRKAYTNIDRVGNTSAASIPLAAAEAVERGVLERGDLALLLAFGGGLTWAAMLIRY
jgi:3-oxoacyl-[acyl-carrier-protein] synthase-3